MASLYVAELQKFKVPFGPDGYKLYDVRSWANLLSFTSPLRALNGTTDAVLVPYATLDGPTVNMQLRLVIDW